jgi:23S rRNA (uracil1939-C5)-methyltransferase
MARAAGGVLAGDRPYSARMIVVRPERFVAGGETIARDDDGRVVFVRGGLPGEEVAVDVVEARHDWRRGVATDVLVASPDRVVPPCPHRLEGCGGCDWQHLALGGQLAAKVDVVADALTRTAKLASPEVRAGGSVPPWAYRTTIRVVGGDDGAPSYRAERSNLPVAASGCLVAHPALVDLLDRIEVQPGVEVALRASAATGEITAWWEGPPDAVAGLPAAVGVGSHAVLHEHVAGHRFRVSAASFFQSGPAAAELLVDTVRRAAPELDTARKVLDAYAGVGLFALAATSPRSHVVTVESSKSSVGDSRMNLADRNATIVPREVAHFAPLPGQRFDVVIADPARTGLGKPGARALVATRAPVLVLVSCDPASLARDAALLAAAGYHHRGTEVVDVFPHTHHVEAVTRFTLAD